MDNAGHLPRFLRAQVVLSIKRRMAAMYDELTQKDIEKMEEEIEYRKLIVRKRSWKQLKKRGRTAI